jgi:hypothetical protein
LTLTTFSNLTLIFGDTPRARVSTLQKVNPYFF